MKLLKITEREVQIIKIKIRKGQVNQLLKFNTKLLLINFRFLNTKVSILLKNTISTPGFLLLNNRVSTLKHQGFYS